MTAHALLPGCQTPWRHDCPGRDAAVAWDRAEQAAGLTTSGLVCHCPCHRLERRIAELEAALGTHTVLDDLDDAIGAALVRPRKPGAKPGTPKDRRITGFRAAASRPDRPPRKDHPDA